MIAPFARFINLNKLSFQQRRIFNRAERLFPMEDFLASLAEALKIRGDARAMTVIVASDCRFEPEDTDFGIDFWLLRIALLSLFNEN